jgi:hypothetical protein
LHQARTLEDLVVLLDMSRHRRRFILLAISPSATYVLNRKRRLVSSSLRLPRLALAMRTCYPASRAF